MDAVKDPYAVLELGTSKARSKVAENQADPIWEQLLNLDASSLAGLPEATLCIAVLDHNRVTRDDPIGSAKVRLRAADCAVNGDWVDVPALSVRKGGTGPPQLVWLRWRVSSGQ